MRILLNGEPLELCDPLDVAGLLEQVGAGGTRVAVEVNRVIVPRSAHAGFALHDGDAVELVQALGGG